MSKARKAGNKFETYWFSVDDWNREYRFGINRHPWELSPGHYDEHDTIIIYGKLRNNTKRKFDSGELRLLPSLVPREQWADDTEKIGNAWIENGKLFCSAWILSDVFYSLPAVLAENKFKEMIFTVNNLRYNKGSTDYVRLSHELSDLSDES